MLEEPPDPANKHLLQPADAPTRDLSLRTFAATWWRSLFAIDGRVWRTLAVALARPGQHASHHLSHRGAGYLHPVRFYLLVNFIFFLVVPFLNAENLTVWQFDLDSLSQMPPNTEGAVARQIETWPGGEPVYRAVFDERLAANQAVFLFTMIPMFGVPLYVILRRRRRFLAEHLLFATGLVTFLLLALFAFGLVAMSVRLIVPPLTGQVDAATPVLAVLILVWMVWLLTGFVGSARRFYRLRLRSALPVGLFTFLCWILSTWVYGKLLFWQTLLTMRS